MDWMHPSWRDLVIAHLEANSDQRMRFLKQCGIDGFMLALSRAGGRLGEREFPLLHESGDWEALLSSVERVVTSGKDPAWKILTWLQQQPPVVETIVAERSYFSELTRLLIEKIRHRWDDIAIPRDPRLLSLFYRVCDRIRPLPYGPKLESIWDNYFSVASLELDTFCPSSPTQDLEAVFRWLRLIDVIYENEPRFLRQINFPVGFDSTLSPALEKMYERSELDHDWESSDECETEYNFLEEMCELLGKVARIMRDKEDLLSEICANLENSMSSVNEKKDVREEEEMVRDEEEDKKRAKKRMRKSSSKEVKKSQDVPLQYVPTKVIFAEL